MITVKLHTTDPVTIKAMVIKSLGGKEIYSEPGLSILKLNNGSVLEVYSPGSNYPDYLFKKNNMVIGYQVQDLEQALKEAEYSGLKQLASGRANGNCYAYYHLCDNEGNLIELQEMRD